MMVVAFRLPTGHATPFPGNRPLPAAPGQPNQITRLLQEVAAGRDQAENALLEHVYVQLLGSAQYVLNLRRVSLTLQATGLVDEAYMRMLRLDVTVSAEVEWRDRRHFYRAAAESMRRILIEHARRRW